jgi:superfamily II DNA or RNA helicase
MSIQFSDFIPYYPLFDDNLKYILSNEETEGTFNYDIYRKKEFFETKLKKFENRPIKPGDLLNHQVFMSRFLSTKTPYNGVLLFQAMGTGKACTSIGIIEKIKNDGNYNGALIMMKNERLIQNYVKELVTVCTEGQYLPKNAKDYSRRDIEKKTGDFYQFKTFAQFATGKNSNSIKNMSDENIIKYYSNHIIILDEAHNLRPAGDKEQYEQINRFLHLVKNCKIVLMTGTPMRDSADEIAYLMNLILPEDRQMPVDKEFNEIFINQEGVLKDEKIDEFKQYIAGRVSYLKSMENLSIKIKYIGERRNHHFILDYIKPSDFQLESYKNAYNIDLNDKEKGIYSNSTEASLCVFPSSKKQNWGKAGKLWDKELVTNISKYSCKYAKCIERINENGGIHFIYSDSLNGSGVKTLAYVLTKLGFEKSVNGGEKDARKRFCLISGEVESAKLLRTINDPKNKNGEIIKVIIGTSVLSEGFTLKNILNIHILTPFWNFARIEQTIARGIRFASHKDLEMDDKIVEVKVYLYTMETTGVKSIDEEMYKRSETKDLVIKSIERVIKETSFDCALNRDRNILPPSYDFSRECDFRECDYKCDFITQKQYLSPDIDISTYNLYYSDNEVAKITSIIDELFKVKTVINISDIRVANKNLLLKTIEMLITFNHVVIDSLGFKAYIRTNGKVIFLTYDLEFDASFFSSFYQENFALQEYQSFECCVNKMFSDNYPKLLDKMIGTTDLNEKIKTFNKFSINAKEVLLEQCLNKWIENGRTDLSTISKNPSEQQPLSLFVLSQLSDFLLFRDGIYISTLLTIPRCRDTKNVKWNDCNDKIQEIIGNIQNERKVNLEKNKYGIYGINNSTDFTNIKNFKIREVSKTIQKESQDDRKITKGKVCDTWNKELLLILINKLKIPHQYKPDNETRQNLLKKCMNSEDISKWFLKDKESKQKKIETLKKNAQEAAIQKRKSKKDIDIEEINEDDVVILEDLQDDDLKRLLYWESMKKPMICKEIRDFLNKEGLLTIVSVQK